MFSARADALFFGCKPDHKLVTRATGKRSSPTPAAWPGPTAQNPTGFELVAGPPRLDEHAFGVDCDALLVCEMAHGVSLHTFGPRDPGLRVQVSQPRGADVAQCDGAGEAWLLLAAGRGPCSSPATASLRRTCRGATSSPSARCRSTPCLRAGCWSAPTATSRPPADPTTGRCCLGGLNGGSSNQRIERCAGRRIATAAFELHQRAFRRRRDPQPRGFAWMP